ncbi:MMPL family transporter [Dactylosporangium aurantiacum]|uniref:MMPL family transporter n=1 Tax=Dactylosporangium aurantiacum TaxID=35754 RepID=A0A9Q9ICW3_9ACTN|nr:MMPL family transporter [Dactylosporangium aurantiacum]MDG6105191.1 MMPL family transporter [Dactylosporangium aurantiacum]UWZ51712.1 MMPL family transporter [Dactylosporangium aurantiacum]
MTELVTQPKEPDLPNPVLGPLGRLARVAYRRRGRTLVAWAVALVAAVVLSMAFGGEFAADYSAPGSDSKAAQRLLQERFASQSGATVTVVVRADNGVAGAKSDVQALLAKLATAPHVAGVADPFAAPGGISADGRTAVADLRLDVVNPDDMPVEASQRLIDIAGEFGRDGLKVALGGQSIQRAEQGEIGSEGIGLAAAIIILLLMFGSVIAAGLPVLVAVAGLAVSSTLTGVLIRFVDAPDWSTSLATMMGIGIGIDYVLLMVTRFREWRAAGLDPEAATVATLDTAGRSVMVAGSTVVVSMLGLFAMGLSFMRGAALVTILGVVVVLAASVTLFPALLGYLGRHVDRLRLPLGRRATVTVAAGGHVEPGRGWLRWSALIQRHRFVSALLGVAILLALAAPFLGVRFGFPDAGNNREETTTRQAYDLVADGFGPGANGPLVLAVQLPRAGDTAALDKLAAALPGVDGVAAAMPAQVNQDGTTAVVTVLPRTGPQDARTEDLVERLRDMLPQTVAGTGAEVHVGGVTATAIDSTANIARRIPLLIGGVVLLSMLLLLVSFRSVAVAVKAAVMNLLSVAAAYGVVALVLQGGWAGRLVGIDTETPLPAFVPVLMFAVLFGLSMDYEVFLVSRMREVWTRTGDNRRAVTDGLASTARVITAAAAIMIAVFAAFIPSPDLVLKVIGVGMASAILLDATVVRLLLVPAVMHVLGRVNWWMPRWLARVLPELHVEGKAEEHLPAEHKELVAAG